ncbi:MAG TPA: ABC transporter permease subunit [Haliangium sp.]|nr:ABC transporter permease subunit [Haliangium sp.]
MIERIYAIALNTFREASRRRVIWGIVMGVIGFNMFGIALGELSLQEQARVARDVGLAGISIFGCVTAMVLGVSLLYNEVQRRTIHTILAKPLRRSEFVVGKYVGMAATLTVLVVLFALVMTGLLALQEVALTQAVVQGVALAYVEVLVVAAVAIFFSAVSSPFLSGMFTFLVFFLGRITPEIRIFIDTTESPAIRAALRGALYLVPDLHLFSISGSTVEGAYVSVHDNFVTWGYVGTSVAYGLLYITTLLVLAALIFSRRDLT